MTKIIDQVEPRAETRDTFPLFIPSKKDNPPKVCSNPAPIEKTVAVKSKIKIGLVAIMYVTTKMSLKIITHINALKFPILLVIIADKKSAIPQPTRAIIPWWATRISLRM